MIQPLRTVHRRAFFALAVVLPAILLAGIEGRLALRAWHSVSLKAIMLNLRRRSRERRAVPYPRQGPL